MIVETRMPRLPRPGNPGRSARAAALGALLVLSGCAVGNKKMVLEVQGTVMYDKPTIRQVAHTLADRRAEGGPVTIAVTVLGDPGLRATFDVSPGIVERQPMTEAPEGTYTGTFSFPRDLTGGPYTVVGRLEHRAAGEVIRKDPQAVTIRLPLPRR